jgi:hypothetical protein
VVVGRRELSAILLAVIALVFYLVLLSTMPSSAQTGGDTTNDGQSTITDDITIDEQITVQEDEDLQEDLIIDEPTTPERSQRKPRIVNIPNKPLPPTGGLPVYIMVGSFVLVGAGLLGLGVSIRRGPRR